MGTNTSNSNVTIQEKLAEITVIQQTFNNEVLFQFKGIPTVPGPCDGRPDGTPCGFGCKCLAGQPWYSSNALASMGVTLKK